MNAVTLCFILQHVFTTLILNFTKHVTNISLPVFSTRPKSKRDALQSNNEQTCLCCDKSDTATLFRLIPGCPKDAKEFLIFYMSFDSFVGLLTLQRLWDFLLVGWLMVSTCLSFGALTGLLLRVEEAEAFTEWLP